MYYLFILTRNVNFYFEDNKSNNILKNLKSLMVIFDMKLSIKATLDVNVNPTYLTI